MNALLVWLTQYGYAGLFGLLIIGIVGAPVPDETLLVFCGYLAYSGRLHFAGILLSAFCGSVCGITISYYLGCKFGRSILKRYGHYVHATPKRIQQAETLFQRFGPVLLSVGYFIPGVRHFTAVVAGMAGLRYVRFALFAYLGAAVWVSVFVTMGFVFSDKWQHSSEVFHEYSLVAMAAGGLLVFSLWLLQRLRSRY